MSRLDYHGDSTIQNPGIGGTWSQIGGIGTVEWGEEVGGGSRTDGTRTKFETGIRAGIVRTQAGWTRGKPAELGLEPWSVEPKEFFFKFNDRF